MDLNCITFNIYIQKKKKKGFRVMHGINQLNTLIFFHITLIHFLYAHYPIQTLKRTTTQK